MNKHNKEVFYVSDEKVSAKDDIFIIKMKKDDQVIYFGENWPYSGDLTTAREFATKKDLKLALRKLKNHTTYKDHEFYIEKVTRIIHFTILESEAQ